MVRKFLLLFLFIIFFGFFPSKIFAQQNNYPINTNSNVPQNFHNYTQSAFIEIFAALSCQLSGIDPINPNGQCLGVDQKTGKISFVKNGGVLGFINGSITAMYDIPIHSNDYFKTLASNFGIAKKAAAANNSIPNPGGSVGPGEGAGFQSLIPFQGLWRTMRNMVYVLFVLLFLFIGLGIMFRVKIDPRTVMTIQNQLPKIIIALILVTFSYAIAGFMIDAMNVTMYISYGIIKQATTKSLDNLTPAAIQGQNPFYAAGAIYSDKPFVGLPKLVQDATGDAVDMFKDASGIGKGSDQLDVAIDTSKKLGLDKIPDVVKFATQIFDIPQKILDETIGRIPVVGDMVAGTLGIVFKAPKAIINSLAGNDVFNPNATLFNGIIHAVSITAGIWGGVQVGQLLNGSIGAQAESSGGISVFSYTVQQGIVAMLGPLGAIPGAAIAGVVITAATEQLLRNVLPNLLVFFLILSILITSMLRLWYQLLKAYLLVLLGVIFAPFWIALGVIPGSQSVGFVPWLKNLAANLSVFPVTYTMFLIAKIVIDGVKPGNTPFLPPFIGDQNSGGFGAVIAIGILLLTPQVLEMVRDFFKVQRFKYGAAISSSIAVGQQMVGAPIKGTMNKVWGVDPYTKEPKKLTRMGLERFARSQSSFGRGLGKVFSIGAGEKEGKQQERITGEKARGARFASMMKARQQNRPDRADQIRRSIMKDFGMNEEQIENEINAQRAKAEAAAAAEAAARTGQSRGPEVATGPAVPPTPEPPTTEPPATEDGEETS